MKPNLFIPLAIILAALVVFSCNNNSPGPSLPVSISVDIDGVSYQSTYALSTLNTNATSGGLAKNFTFSSTFDDSVTTVQFAVNYFDSTSTSNCMQVQLYELDPWIDPNLVMTIGYVVTDQQGSVLKAYGFPDSMKMNITSCTLGTPNLVSGTFSGKLRSYDFTDTLTSKLTNGMFEDVPFILL